MKNHFISFIMFLVIISSCKKVACDCELVPAKLGFDSGCIERTYYPINEYGITDSTRMNVVNLFLKNGIDTNVYKCYNFYTTTYKSTIPLYLNIIDSTIDAYQYYNGYRIFDQVVQFHFGNEMNDSIYKQLSKPIKYKVLNTDSTLQLGQLRYLFMIDLNRFQALGNHFADSCMSAEKGYFKYDSITLRTSWLVSPLNSSLPNSIYYDSTGQFVSYMYY